MYTAAVRCSNIGIHTQTPDSAQNAGLVGLRARLVTIPAETENLIAATYH